MLLQREYRTRCGVIHYWLSKKMDSEVTLVFLPGLTADHHLFDKESTVCLSGMRPDMRLPFLLT